MSGASHQNGPFQMDTNNSIAVERASRVLLNRRGTFNLLLFSEICYFTAERGSARSMRRERETLLSSESKRSTESRSTPAFLNIF